MKNVFNKDEKDKPLSRITNLRKKTFQNKQYTSKLNSSKIKHNYATQEIKMGIQLKQKQILLPKKLPNSNNQLTSTLKHQNSLKQYLTDSKKTSPMNKVSFQFNTQLKNKKSVGIVSLMSSLNTPKSTHCDTPKAKTLPNVQNTITITLDEAKKEITNDDNTKNEFIKDLLTMVMCFGDTKMNNEDNNRNNFDNIDKKKESTNIEINDQLIHLQKKINAIEYNTLMLSQTMLPSKDKNNALIDSTIRTETYQVYFDFMFKLLTEIKSLLTITKVSNTQFRISELLKESSTTKKENSICDIEESQLNEKNDIIVPTGKGNHQKNVKQDTSLFISSIHSDFYQKLIENSFQLNNSKIIIDDNCNKSPIKLQKELSKITSNQRLNQIYSKIISYPNHIPSAFRKTKTNERSDKKTKSRQTTNIMCDITPVQLYPQNSFVENDNAENYIEQSDNRINCIQAIKPTKPISVFNEAKKTSVIQSQAIDIEIRRKNNCIIT